MALELGKPAVLRIVGISAMIYFVVPLLFLVWLYVRGAIESLEARDHERRKKPLFIGCGFLVGAVPAMVLYLPVSSDLPLVVSALFALNGLILAFITLRFKISLHVAGICCLASIPAALWLVDWVTPAPPAWPYFAVSFLLVALVIWARLHQKAHSRKEVFWGLIFGLFAPGLEVVLFKLGFFS